MPGRARSKTSWQAAYEPGCGATAWADSRRGLGGDGRAVGSGARPALVVLDGEAKITAITQGLRSGTPILCCWWHPPHSLR